MRARACACACVRVPQHASDARLRHQQEAFVGGQGDAVGHVEGVQQDVHASRLRVVGEEAAEAVQLDHLRTRSARS